MFHVSKVHSKSDASVDQFASNLVSYIADGTAPNLQTIASDSLQVGTQNFNSIVTLGKQLSNFADGGNGWDIDTLVAQQLNDGYITALNSATSI